MGGAAIGISGFGVGGRESVWSLWEEEVVWDLGGLWGVCRCLGGAIGELKEGRFGGALGGGFKGLEVFLGGLGGAPGGCPDPLPPQRPPPEVMPRAPR